MNDMSKGFELLVHVPAEEWAYVRRRSIYLEAVLVQALKDRGTLCEWYDAQELLDMRLPGLPTSKAWITRKASEQGWISRVVTGKGGDRFQYHIASLPPRAFDALIERIVGVNAAPIDADELEPVELPTLPEIAAAERAIEAIDDNTAPPWVLPFMRLLKGGAHGDIGAAWHALPDHLPPGVVLPTRQEAAETIVRLGLAKTC